MSEQSKSLHSIIFIKETNDTVTSKNTWDDWHLIPSSQPSVPEAIPQVKYVDIPGSDNQLDISDYLVGRPVLSPRKGTFDFYVYNFAGKTRTEHKKEIASFFDGSIMKVILEDEDEALSDNKHYVYTGRCYLQEYRPDASYSHVIIAYQFNAKVTQDTLESFSGSGSFSG